MSEPKLIRNDSPHQVSMPEGTNVATGKKATAQEPTVRKVLAAPDETVNDFSVDKKRVLAPDADGPKPVEAQPTFDRHLNEDHVLAPAAAEAEHEGVNSVVKRVENDHMALLPETLSEQPHVALVPEAMAATRPEQAPVIIHSENDQLVALPEAIPLAESEQGLLIKRSEQDRFVAVPEPVAETMAQHKLSASAPALEDPVTATPAAAEAQALELSETMLTMLQMDFPARVVKLKIENDKVRTKLDALQDSSRS